MIDIFEKAEQLLKNHHIRIFQKDVRRPWGGFFVIEEKDLSIFIDSFFKELTPQLSTTSLLQKLSPKLLIVLPHKQLSWQYHHRRSEIWKLIEGEAGLIRSHTDEQKPLEKMILHQSVLLQQGERHRLVGLETPAIVAEIWQHSFLDNPSDEEDIVRLQDDFGR